MKAFSTMFKTELKLSIRGMDMVIFAIGMPAVVVILIGIIYGTKPAEPGSAYTFLEQSFGAVSTIAICAGGIMGLPLLISDYRHRKILKRFQVTPASPALILAVHLAIYAAYSVVSLLLVYTISVLFFQCRFYGSPLLFSASYLLVMVSTFSIGLAVGGLAPDLKTASILASILYFPMVIFSGATLPYEIMPPVLQKIVAFLPLTHGIKLLKAAALGLPLEHVSLSIAILSALALVCTAAALKFFKWE